jgi:parvulin-like peptidyl-prolyl isomerase
MKKFQKLLKKFLANKRIASINKKHLAIFLGVIVFAGTLFAVKSLFIVAIVNNTVITRFSLDQELEKQYGQKVLQNRVTEALIKQEAKKRNISITKEELTAEMSKVEGEIKASGQDLDTLLSAYGMTRADYEKQTNLQLLVNKLVSGNNVVTDEEITAYFDTNKTSYPAGTTFESVKEDIRTQLNQSKTSENIQTWLTDLEQKAKITYFLNL